ncbi:MAG: hypothetical protein OFPI_30560 [Osedax symbiont Rs2]|nr:MAG: hypothetical protein OFPI_30560 [Osedax symbiont Rs2]
MHYPQSDIEKPLTRKIVTSCFDNLANFHINKNRGYTQLEPGKLNAQFFSASLGNVEIIKEVLNVGARIEAAPNSAFIPFAYSLPTSGQYHFCGRAGSNNSFTLASGGVWDMSFNDRIEYAASVFNKEYFFENYETLKGRVYPKQYLISQLTPCEGLNGIHYFYGVSNILTWLLSNPQILNYPDVIRLLCSQVFQLTVDALPHTESVFTLKETSKRTKGVRRVIEYLQVHASELPDIQMLCTIAGISERSLQYGFIDSLGTTPIQYLRLVRLNGARSDLLAAQKDKVSDVAMRWGFLELGRFSKEYKKLFHELPSKTISSA